MTSCPSKIICLLFYRFSTIFLAKVKRKTETEFFVRSHHVFNGTLSSAPFNIIFRYVFELILWSFAPFLYQSSRDWLEMGMSHDDLRIEQAELPNWDEDTNEYFSRRQLTTSSNHRILSFACWRWKIKRPSFHSNIEIFATCCAQHTNEHEFILKYEVL